MPNEKKQSWTPAPWVVFSTETGAGRVLKHQVRANARCAFGEESFTVTLRNEADARLIAAAPELLAALQTLERAIANNEPFSRAEHDQARAAIAKAMDSGNQIISQDK